MNKKIKVLHILWSGGIGGTEEYITTLVQHINPAKYEIYLCFLSRKGIIFDEINSIFNNTIFIGMKSGIDLLAALRFFLFLHREKFDIIHSHTPNILANLIISLFKKPRKVFTEHVGPGAKEIFKKRRLFYKLFKNSFRLIIAISELVKQKLIKNMHVDSDKICVVHNGIDINKFDKFDLPPNDLAILKQSKPHTRFIGFIGRMDYFKRPDLFIRIAREIIKKKNNFYFIMVGDGPQLKRLKEMATEYKVEDYIIFLGFRRDIPNILSLFDALLFTSEGEGFGVVIIEAMAKGVPIFAINSGAIAEILLHKVNGILLETTHADIIAQLLIDTLENQNLIKMIKNNCVIDVHNKFSIKSCAIRIEQLYQSILS